MNMNHVAIVPEASNHVYNDNITKRFPSYMIAISDNGFNFLTVCWAQLAITIFTVSISIIPGMTIWGRNTYTCIYVVDGAMKDINRILLTIVLTCRHFSNNMWRRHLLFENIFMVSWHFCNFLTVNSHKFYTIILTKPVEIFGHKHHLDLQNYARSIQTANAVCNYRLINSSSIHQSKLIAYWNGFIFSIRTFQSVCSPFPSVFLFFSFFRFFGISLPSFWLPLFGSRKLH